MPTAPLLRGKDPAPKLPVGCVWQPVMFKDGILVADQSVNLQPKCSRELQDSTLALIGLDRQLERPDPINQEVISCPDPYTIVPTILFKLIL